jgi:hypothetical protein
MILKQGIRGSVKNWPDILANIKKTEKENKINYAYHAGWADGDGCLKLDCYALKITEESPVYNLANTFLTSVYLSTPEKRKGHGDPTNPRKSTVLTGRRYEYFTHKIMPFLMEKRNQGYKLLKKFNLFKKDYSYLEYSYDEFSSYLAGFTEAEGSFYDGYNKKGKQNFKYGWSVSNTNKSLLHSLKRLIKKNYNVDCKVVLHKKGGKNQLFSYQSQQRVNRKDRYVIHINGKNSIPLVKALYPYLMIPYKKEKCKNLMEHKFR